MTVGFGDVLFGVALTGAAIELKINRQRATLGYSPVFADADLSSAAARHTSDMAANSWMYKSARQCGPLPPGVRCDAHISSDNHTTPAQRIMASAAAGGWRPENDMTGEILYWSSAPLNGDAPFDWWMHSPDHRAIIENPSFTHIGFSASHTDSANEWVYDVTFARAPARALFAHDGHVIDVQGISTANGALVQLWDWWGGGNQRWRLEPVGDGYVRVVAQHSGKVLDVADASMANGARVVQWDWWGGDNQKFRPEVYAIGELTLTAKHSGKVIEFAGMDENNGVLIQQWDRWDGANQRWKY